MRFCAKAHLFAHFNSIIYEAQEKPKYTRHIMMSLGLVFLLHTANFVQYAYLNATVPILFGD